MAFDTTELDAACLDIGDDATWITDTGPVPISIIISTSPDMDGSDGFQVLTHRITGETTAVMIAGLKREDAIIQNEIRYSVSGIEVDATGWAVIELEKL